MKRFLVFVAIICLVFLLSVGAQEPTKVEPIPEKPVTRLSVKIIDGMNDNLIKLDNCIVQVIGELHICEDSFNYSNAFTEGDVYDITIWVRLKE